MIKSELVKSISKKFEYLRLPEAKEVVDFIFEEIYDTIKKQEEVKIDGFGSFIIQTLKPRAFYNFKEGRMMSPVVKKKIKFKPTLNLRNSVS